MARFLFLWTLFFAVWGRAAFAGPLELDYAMQRRFQPDWGNPLAVTLPNSASYAQPKDFLVTLMLRSPVSSNEVCTWSLTGNGKTTNVTGTNPSLRLTQGLWNATATLRNGTNVTGTGSLAVDVKDLLIVAMGDSCASGEGSPEIPMIYSLDPLTYNGSNTPQSLNSSDLNDLPFSQFPIPLAITPVVPPQWARSTESAMTLEHRLSHRSVLSYSARYAMALEASDPHRSVTYVNVAQSGATTWNLLNRHLTSLEDSRTPLPLQLAEVKQIVGHRPIDKLLLSIGGNDVQFGPIYGSLMFPDVFPFINDLLPSFTNSLTFSNAVSIQDSVFSTLMSGPQAPLINWTFRGYSNNTNTLVSNYASIDASIRSSLTVSNIAISGYPDTLTIPVTGSDSNTVLWPGRAAFDILSSNAISSTDSLLALRLYLKPVDSLIGVEAAKHGWSPIGGILETSAGHGYECPESSRWVVTARESLIREGSTPTWYGQVFPVTSFGMLHPNSRANVATARLVAENFSETNVAARLAVEVTLKRSSIPPDAPTPVQLGAPGASNSFLLVNTYGQPLGLSNVSVSGGFSVALQPSSALMAGDSSSFSIANPSNNSPGLSTGVVTISFTNAEVPPFQFTVASHDPTGIAGINWMASLPDTAKLSSLTIPGTHDSMALYEPLPGTAQCQEESIGWQLTNGVRFLDIRCRHLTNAFAIYHGAISQQASFDDVLSAVGSFLSNNPSETVVMSVKEEATPKGNTRTFEETFRSYVARNPALWSLGTTLPVLGHQGSSTSVRGKIVLVRRFSGTEGIPATNWPDNPVTIVSAPPLMIGDYYRQNYTPLEPLNTGNYDDKWSSVSSGLLAASEDQAGGFLHLTFSSGYISYGGAPLGIPLYASEMNGRLSAFFAAAAPGHYGIIPMDFPSADLIRSIYLSGLAAMPAR